MSEVAACFAALAVVLASRGVVRLHDDTDRHRVLVATAGGFSVLAASWTLVELTMSPILVVLMVAGAAATIRALRRRRARRAARRRRDRVLAACEGLAADLSCGLPQNQALRSMAEDWSELQPVADTADIGGDVPTAFRAVAATPGAEMLRVAAAAWSVAERAGAGLADAVALAVDELRAEQATGRVVAAELAAALATARLLALLPIGILVLGRGMGGDPFGFLLATTAGQICLAFGLFLAWSGTVWLEHIVEQVERH